jgi:hypothetical protein
MDLGDVVSTAAGAISPVAAIGTGVLNYLGTQSTNQQNAAIAAANNQWSAQQYATRYQTMTQDMMKAGLNPMLAYSQSAGIAPTAQQVQFQNPMASATQAYNENMQTRSNVDLQTSNAWKANADTDRINQETERIGKEMDNISKEGNRLDALSNNLAKSAELMGQQKIESEARVLQLNQIVKNLVQEGRITKADADAIQKTGGIGRIAREMKPLADIGTDVMDSLKPWMKKAPRSSEIRENKTFYDKEGNVSGGSSTNRYSNER